MKSANHPHEIHFSIFFSLVASLRLFHMGKEIFHGAAWYVRLFFLICNLLADAY